MKPNIYRAWINQPSTQQPLHDKHGQRCIAVDYGTAFVDIYFTDGDTHSMRVPRLSVSQIHLSAATQGTTL